MKKIIIKPVKPSAEVFRMLEKKGLIRTLKPTKKCVETKTKTGTVDILYTARNCYGGHRLMCIGKRTKFVQFYYHKDNEDFLFLNPQNTDYQKLYLVFAKDKIYTFSAKLRNETLTGKDFTALEIEYNNPDFSFFTVLKNTVHCEVVADENKQHPVFFVTESSKLKNNKIVHKNIKFSVCGE